MLSIMYSKEDILFAALKVNPARIDSYCQAVDEPILEEIRKLPSGASMDQLKDRWYQGRDGSDYHYHSSRYRACNMHSVFYHGTIEWRLFNSTLHAGEAKANIILAMAISAQGINQKYTQFRKTPIGDNPAFTFRTFLLRLGLIGPEYKNVRILYPQSYHPYVENPPTIKQGRLHRGKKPHRKLTGLRALYYRYLYELGALPRKPRRPSYAVRQDAYKLDQRIRQMEFLSKHNIDTLEQLETHRKALQTEIGQLQTKRKQLPKTDDVQSQHESVNTALKQLRQEERLCRKIAEHSIEVQQHLTEARRDRAEQQKQEQERARDRRPNIDLTL